MQVTGAEDVKFDYQNREITIYLSETTDMRKVVIQDYQLDVDYAVPSIQLLGVHDLTSPLKFNLRVYQDYDWKIKAVRNIERYFTVDGQIGSSHVDEINCRAVAMVAEGTNLSNINVTSLKLGPREISTYSKQLSELKDFTDGATIDVTAFGETERWSLFIEVTTASVTVEKINPWATSAYVTALGIAGRDNRFQYRLADAADWTDVSPEDVTSDGGTFVAHIKNLTPETAYVVRALCDDDSSDPVEFVTSAAPQLPNASFEYTSLVKGESYYKFYDPDCGVEDGKFMFWGSGNGEGSEGTPGSANMGIVITVVDKEDKVDGNQSVCAQTSQMAGILAAGNLFTGQFAGLVQTEGGKVNFGRPWTSRPKALKIWCKYITGKIDIVKGMPPGVVLGKEDYDRAQIKFALGNWTPKDYFGTNESPVHVNTTDPSTFVDFNTDKCTIANGDLIIYNDGYVLNGGKKESAGTSAWIEYTIPLNYHDLEEIPTHIIISCAASQYGDYFTGCSSSKLWLDKAELVY